MTWRVARSLLQLRAEVNAAAPRRSKRHDGTIGDRAHQGRRSDHNPDSGGVVRAMDVTDDPSGGHDATRFAEWLRLARDPRVKYVIDEGRIFSSYATGSRPAWTWGPYTGSNPHTGHTHVSVVAGAPGDDPAPWGWTPAEPEVEDMTHEELVVAVREAVRAAEVGGKPLVNVLEETLIRLRELQTAVSRIEARQT